MTAGRGGTQTEDSKGRGLYPGPSQGCPSRASALRCETCHHESLGEALWTTLWWLLSRDGMHYGMQGKNILGLHRIYWAIFKGRRGEKDEEKGGI